MSTRLPTLADAYELTHGRTRAGSGKPVILVVEDDIEILSSVAEQIRDEGFEVLTAGNGWQALDQARERQLSLVLVDLKMPEMGGAELVQRLRQNGCLAPLVLVSAAHDLAAQAAALRADGFLAKPFSLEDIARVTHQYCTPK